MKKVVIVGAGPAGLATAYTLLKSEIPYEVVVLEQESQVGGISKTICHHGNRMDLGGHRFFTKNSDVYKMWLELLQLQGEPINEKIEAKQKEYYPGKADPSICEDVMLLRRRISRIFYDNKFFEYPVNFSLDTLKKLGMKKAICCGCGYLRAMLFKRKENSLEDFYINRFGKPLYELFFKGYTTKLWGKKPSELDSSWGSQRVKKISLVKLFLEYVKKSLFENHKTKETSLIEEFYYPKYGPGQMWDKMSEKILELGGQIILNAKCERIISKNKEITEIEFSVDEKKHRIDCDYLISSLPIKNLIEYVSPNVPQQVKEIAINLPYRDFVTVGLLVKELEIKNETEIEMYNQLIPDCWIYVQDKSVNIGRIQVFNNWSPYLNKDPQNTVWLGLEYFCTEGDHMWNLPDADFVKMAIEEIDKMGILSREKVLDSVVIKVKKAYPAYFGTYNEFERVKEYLWSYSNLYCVGRNGQHRYNNMDHSMLTGILAAEAIILGKSNRAVWEVNTEKDYHESGN